MLMDSNSCKPYIYKPNVVNEIFIIGPNERANICFKENLILVDENKNKKGDIIIRVEEITSKDSGFLVYISSKQCLDNQLHEMSITSKIGYNLKTIEEIRTEITNNGEKKKKLYLSYVPETDMYEMSVTTKLLNNQQEKTIFLETQINENSYPISEGANIILLRKIALCGYVGTFSVKSILINGVICTAEYCVYQIAEPESVSEKLLYPQHMKMVIRNITIPGKLHPMSLEHITVLTKRGQIFKHKWADSSLTIQTDCRHVIQDTNILSDGIIPSKTCWKEDMELSSIFKDKEFESLMLSQSFLNDNQQASHLVEEFLTNVLLKKPKDPLKFAIKFFTG